MELICPLEEDSGVFEYFDVDLRRWREEMIISVEVLLRSDQMFLKNTNYLDLDLVDAAKG